MYRSSTLVLVLALFAGVAGAVDTSNWMPMEVGNQWQYRDDGGQSHTVQVLAGTPYVNGVPTLQILNPDGVYTYETHGAAGHFVHKLRFSDYYPNVGYLQVTTTFTPPLERLPGNAAVGVLRSTSGTATMTFGSYGSFTINYAATSKLVGSETQQVLGNTLQTWRVDSSLRLYGSIEGEAFDETETSSNWLLPDLGLVRETGYLDGSSYSYTLISTNLNLPSDSADLSIGQQLSPSSGLITNIYRLTLQAFNQGPDNAPQTVATVSLPSGMLVHAIQQGAASCSVASQKVICSWDNLISSAGDPPVIQLRPSAVGDYTLTTTITSAAEDANPGNNSVSSELFVVTPSERSGDVFPPGAPDGKVTIADALTILRKALGLVNY